MSLEDVKERRGMSRRKRTSRFADDFASASRLAREAGVDVTEAAEHERERLAEERHSRATDILQMLSVLFTLTTCDGLVVGFEYKDHRYEIREID